MTPTQDIVRVNGVVVGKDGVRSASPPWPLLVMDVESWLTQLPSLHEMNGADAARNGDIDLLLRECSRGVIALRCVAEGTIPTKEEHPILALRMLLSPLLVTNKNLRSYARRLCELYPGPSSEPFWIIDARDSVLHLVHELEFLGELVGPGMLSTTAPAEWLSEYASHLLERHPRVEGP